METRRRRILFVDNESRLSGGEQDLLDLVAALGSRVEAHVALPEEGPLSDALAKAGASIHLFPMDRGLRKLSRWELAKDPLAAAGSVWHMIKTIRAIGKLIGRIQPDLVHTNSMKSHILASIPCRARGVPVIWHIRDILNEGWLRRMFAFLAGHLPLRVLCISRAVQAQFGSSAAQGRTVVVYNGIDVSRFTGRSQEGFRSHLGIPEDHKVVGIVGQIAHWKGQDTFIEAAAKVADRSADTTFLVVGECLFPQNESWFEESLHERVEELSLGSRITFTGWHDDPPEVMKALDIFVHSSRLPEPFGRVIVEGMSAGCCVIASAEGAGPELIEEGEGVIIPPDDPDALAEAITTLLEGTGREAMAQAARRGALRFDISRTADAVQAVYDEMFSAAGA